MLLKLVIFLFFCRYVTKSNIIKPYFREVLQKVVIVINLLLRGSNATQMLLSTFIIYLYPGMII